MGDPEAPRPYFWSASIAGLLHLRPIGDAEVVVRSEVDEVADFPWVLPFPPRTLVVGAVSRGSL
jgi:hypothetical protein